MFRSPLLRYRPKAVTVGASIGVALLMATAVTASADASATPPPRPQGPCDIYAAAGTRCVAAHSTTRALYADYHGPLYQLRRLSDDAMTNVGVVEPSLTPVADAGGYADAAVQDAFCADTTCLITKVYDQSAYHNDLTQAPRGIAAQTGGSKPGPALGGQDNLPIADMAPITIAGHKAYGVFIEPGMGLRNNNTHGIPVDDAAEGMYMVADGRHYNPRCCFDYGNAGLDSRDDGDGTMEAVNFSNRAIHSNDHSYGQGDGPWVMSDQENTQVACSKADIDSTPGSATLGQCPAPYTPSLNFRFVTGVVKGEPHHLTNLAGDSQQGSLSTMYDGPRFKSTYDPMQKQGAIVLGTGGDNSNASIGTFYEGVMTSGRPTDDTDNAAQANIVAAHYDLQRLSLTPADAPDKPRGVQTFTPGSSQDVTETFTNTTGVRAVGVKLSLSVPAGWTTVVKGGIDTSVTFAAVAPGGSVSATFTVTAGATAFNGDLVGNAAWTRLNGSAQSEMATERVRNTSPIKLNEFRIATTSDPTDSFIELSNAGDSAVDLSGWTLTQHPTQQPVSSTITIPAGTTIAAHGHYLLGLANSGLAAPAAAGDSTVYLRNTTGLNPGDTIRIGAETRKITSDATATAAAAATTLWQPLPDGFVTVPAGSTNVPVSSTAGFTVGQKLAIGYGDRTDIVTVTGVGTPGAQARLTAAAAVGDTKIEVDSTANISQGDTIRLDIDLRAESIKVKAVGTSSTGGPEVTLFDPLQHAHSANLPFSDRGTGVTFSRAPIGSPVTGLAYAHSSDEPVQPLGSGIMLDQPLTTAHPLDTAVIDTAVTGAGYQGSPAPDQWFGGPALSDTAGSMVLREAHGLVADSLNYGDLVDPWLAEGYQPLGVTSTDPAMATCYVSLPSVGRSALRSPDGTDTDRNCADPNNGHPADFIKGPPSPGGTN